MRRSRPDEEEKDGPHFVLDGAVAVLGSIAISTITYADPGDRNWAVAVLRSLIAPPQTPDDGDAQ